MSGVNSVSSSASSVYREQTDLVGSKDPTYTPQLDTIDPAAAATKWTPPSCLARYCTYVKHRITDFFEWVCSLFCSSKAVTKEQLETAFAELVTMLGEIKAHGRFDKRYEGVNVSSPDDVYRYLADRIEHQEIVGKVYHIVSRWEEYKDNLSGVVLTERQLRADRRRLIEIATSLETFAHSDLPKKTTPAMRDKVKDYSLGKLTYTKLDKVISLRDMSDEDKLKVSPELAAQFDQLIDEIRKSSLEKFDPQIKELSERVNARYEELTEEDLRGDSQAVHVLADCIAVREIWDSLIAWKGDISEASLAKRIATLQQRLAQPFIGVATDEMYKKVKEFDFLTKKIISMVCSGYPESLMGNRLKKLVFAVQRSQGE